MCNRRVGSGAPNKRNDESRPRIRGIKWRDNWSVEIALVIAWLLILLFVVIPWMAAH